jgi:hypothetical protein
VNVSFANKVVVNSGGDDAVGGGHGKFGASEVGRSVRQRIKARLGAVAT